MNQLPLDTIHKSIFELNQNQLLMSGITPTKIYKSIQYNVKFSIMDMLPNRQSYV